MENFEYIIKTVIPALGKGSSQIKTLGFFKTLDSLPKVGIAVCKGMYDYPL